MIFKDYYKILGLDNNKVTNSEIKTAYREQAKLYHPDVNEASEERFKDINEAYKILSDSSSKRKYDRSWNYYIGKKNKAKNKPENPETLFSMFFGNLNTNKEEIESSSEEKKKKNKTSIKGENVETEINISMEEGFYGIDKKISLRTVEGKMKNFSVKVPAGIRENEKIRLIGQGKAGKNGGKNGDLFIKIHIDEKENIKLKGCDIYTNLFLTPWEAALGTKTKVNGIDETSTIYIPQGIQSGEKLTIPGKGYKDGKGGRGDLIAEVKVMVPKKLSSEEKEIFEKLKQISKFNPRKIYD